MLGEGKMPGAPQFAARALEACALSPSALKLPQVPIPKLVDSLGRVCLFASLEIVYSA